MSDVTRQKLLSSMFSAEKINEDTYRCSAPHMGGAFARARLFGGQAVSQAFRAIQEHKGTHIVPTTMHYRFCAPGKTHLPIDYQVEEWDSATRVNAVQDGRIIGTAHCRLSDDQFPHYDLDLDYIPEPETVMSLSEIVQEVVLSKDAPVDLRIADRIIYEVRLVEWARYPHSEIPRNIYWARLQDDCSDEIPLNCGLQASLLLSDFFIIQIVEDTYHKDGFRLGTAASLSHSVRFHQRNEDINPRDWFLYRVECESIGYQRAKLRATVYDSKRKAVLTVEQEAYVERKPRKTQAKL